MTKMAACGQELASMGQGMTGVSDFSQIKERMCPLMDHAMKCFVDAKCDYMKAVEMGNFLVERFFSHFLNY